MNRIGLYTRIEIRDDLLITRLSECLIVVCMVDDKYVVGKPHELYVLYLQ